MESESETELDTDHEDAGYSERKTHRSELRKLRDKMKDLKEELRCQTKLVMEVCATARAREAAVMRARYPFLSSTVTHWPRWMGFELMEELRSDLVAKLRGFGYEMHEDRKGMYFAVYPTKAYPEVYADEGLHMRNMHIDVARHLYVAYVLPRQARQEAEAQARATAATKRANPRNSRPTLGRRKK